ncbi:hypothetical protein [Aminipila sp.]|uniref:hypothetical protein n=1 Tax=Aminipila sp. TaxID=2060095 RepID=UPI0028998BEB|nr:hypothetical protein [Aminipila sp.]
MAHINQLPEYNLTTGQLNLLYRLRIIWRDMATWIRSYLIYTFLESDPELKEAAAQKLMDLPVKYADIFRIFFGNEVADDHTILMTNYTKLLMSLIDATKSGDTDSINEYTNLINENINDRVNFLTYINPFWEKSTMSDLLHTFNNMTINEINTFANKDYQANIDLFSRILTYADRMGDTFAEGMVKYFTFSSREPRVP